VFIKSDLRLSSITRGSTFGFFLFRGKAVKIACESREPFLITRRLISRKLRIMARICQITGKRPTRGSIIHRKGQSKKSGGIGTHVTKVTKRTFRPNLQRVRVVLPSGQVKRMLVSVKAIKAGKIQKA
jgi:large subunit ribosomal protein L28